MKKQIAYLGMGIMGSAMAINLAKAGNTVKVWNRSAGRAGMEKAVAVGCTKCDTIAETIADCEIVFSCVSDVKDVEQILLGPGGVIESAAANTLIVDTATIGPAAAVKIGQALSQRKLRFIDAPVTGGDVGAVNGTLTVMVGGSAADYEEALPFLQAIGKTIRHCGPTGSGQALKLCNQILCAVNLVAVSEALSLAKTFGLDESMLPEVLGTGAGGSWSLQNLGPRIIKEDFAPGFRIKDMLKDLRLVEENSHGQKTNGSSAQDASTTLPGTELARTLFEKCAPGDGLDQGTQAMIKSYRLAKESPTPESEQQSLSRIMVDMSASLLHHGHVRLLKRAKELGHVVVALTTDEQIEKHKGYKPELNYEARKELLLALRYVDEVVPSNWLIEQEFVQQHNCDLLFHGEDNSNSVEAVRTFARTPDISSNTMREKAIASLSMLANSNKCLLTPGPSNLHAENVSGIHPVFTRGDTDFDAIQSTVLEKIRARAGQDSIACMQGSATTAIEVATSNFLYGKVLAITSGYYSDRILAMLKRKAERLQLTDLTAISYDDFMKQRESLQGFAWIVAVSTETADAFLCDLKELKQAANRMQAKLMVDATGSINLEADHELADVCMFSSCKGLGGLTGAAFITYNKILLERLNPNPREFILDLSTYIEKKTTGPAHSLLSMHLIADRFSELGQRVRDSKAIFVEKYKKHLVRTANQPALCTKFTANSIQVPPGTVLYQPRSIEAGAHVICHLFDQFPANRAVGKFYDAVIIE